MRSLAVACLFLASLPVASAQMTHEETVVRTAYARMAYAVDLNTVYMAVQSNPSITKADLDKQLASHSLKFKLSDFTTGNIADIAGSPYEILGQYPDGQDVITTSVSTSNRQEGNSPPVISELATAVWADGPSGVPPHSTVGQTLASIEQESGVNPILRYCTYTVTATLDERSRTYRANFVFGERNKAAPGDAVVGLGGGALNDFLSRPLYPGVLLHTSIRKLPVVQDFLDNTSQSNDKLCKPGLGDVCCNVVTMLCGVSAEDLTGGSK